MTETYNATTSKPEERLISTWTRAAEQVFESLTKGKPQLQWELFEQAADSEGEASFEWWEAQFEAVGDYRVRIGVPAPAAVELGRLAQAVAAANEQDSDRKPPDVRETIELLCDAFGKLLSQEIGKAVEYRGLTQLETPPPKPEVIYSTRITMEGSNLPILVGFDAKQVQSILEEPLRQLPSESDLRRAGLDERSPLGLLLDLELPLTVRFGRVQMPVESVLELKVGSILELEGAREDPVELLVNGSVVAKGEVVAVDGDYGIRILEVLGRDSPRAHPSRG